MDEEGEEEGGVRDRGSREGKKAGRRVIGKGEGEDNAREP